MQYVLLTAKKANKSKEEPEIVTDVDENRKITAAEAIKKLDEVKNFIEVNRSNHMNIIFNDSIEIVEQMKLKNQKQSDIRSFFRSYISFMLLTLIVRKKSSILNNVVFFLAKKSKTLYSGHLVIVDTFFRNHRCPL